LCRSAAAGPPGGEVPPHGRKLILVEPLSDCELDALEMRVRVRVRVTIRVRVRADGEFDVL